MKVRQTLRLQRWIPFAILAVALTAFLWCELQVSRSPVIGRCNYMLQATCDINEVVRHDPYCQVDPLCWDINKVNASHVADATIGSQSGLAVVPFDPLLINDEPTDWLATSNLYRYYILALSPVLLLALVWRRRGFSVNLAIILTSWNVLELTRWSYGVDYAARLFGSSRFDLLPALYYLPSLIWLILLIVLARKNAIRTRNP